jgi:hypothetical protein
LIKRQNKQSTSTVPSKEDLNQPSESDVDRRQ